MGNLPTVTETQTKNQIGTLNQIIVSGSLQEWLDLELKELHRSNEILYHFVIDRANKFSAGAMLIESPQALAISTVLEMVLLLKLVDSSIGEVSNFAKFKEYMKNQFPHGVNGLGNL